MLKNKILTCLVFTVLSIGSWASASDQARIDGIANYLASLSTKNFNYVLERKLLSNEMLQCNFPSIYSSLETVGLMNAINFGPETWEAQFK